MSILGTLLQRKQQREKQSESSWSRLVLGVEAGTLKDPDAILEQLESLKRTPQELDEALQKLAERRSDQKLTGDESKAELAIEQARQKIAAVEAEKERVLAEFDAKAGQAIDAREKAVTRLNAAKDAKRRLEAGATESFKAAVFGPLDEQLAVATEELHSASRVVRDRENWIVNVRSFGSQAATSDKERLPEAEKELARLRQNESDKAAKVRELQDQRAKAVEQLWKPEAGI